MIFIYCVFFLVLGGGVGFEPSNISFENPTFITSSDVNPNLVRVGQCLFAFRDEREFWNTILVRLSHVKMEDFVVSPIFSLPLKFSFHERDSSPQCRFQIR